MSVRCQIDAELYRRHLWRSVQGATAGQLSRILGIPPAIVREELQAMKRDSLVRSSGSRWYRRAVQ